MVDSQEREYYRLLRMSQYNYVPRAPIRVSSTPNAYISDTQRKIFRRLTRSDTFLPDAVRIEFRSLTPADAPASPLWFSIQLPAGARILQSSLPTRYQDDSDSESTDTAPWFRRPIPPEWEDPRTSSKPRQPPPLRIRRARTDSDPQSNSPQPSTVHVTTSEGGAEVTTESPLASVSIKPCMPPIPPPATDRAARGPGTSSLLPQPTKAFTRAGNEPSAAPPPVLASTARLPKKEQQNKRRRAA